ncbi:hypothetical protein ODJ79_22225 [Actinoplanes sp. KI2]|uniref:hypothetical protein n=1 Tax=Actinoplanes sp. KI2 TaxID=2983315 RepID=UPI0021D5C3EE|nr:hypothetical protein [Actinoplanes sp. KI2]MCU7726457.1 hypothetical protein [Actinoplanes sp. KI2]
MDAVDAGRDEQRTQTANRHRLIWVDSGSGPGYLAPAPPLSRNPRESRQPNGPEGSSGREKRG